jgi:excisionase family DNA binding protein
MQLHELGAAVEDIRSKLDQVLSLVSDQKNEPDNTAGNGHLLRVPEVIERYQVSRTKLWDMRRNGELQTVTFGRAVRFRQDDVEALLNQRGAR